MNAMLCSVLPTLLQVVSSLPSPPPCLRLDQQNLPLLNEEHHPAAAAATTTAVNCVVTALVRFMSKELPPPLSVLLAAGALPYSHFNSSFLYHFLVFKPFPRFETTKNSCVPNDRSRLVAQSALKSRKNLQFTATSPFPLSSFQGPSHYSPPHTFNHLTSPQPLLPSTSPPLKLSPPQSGVSLLTRFLPFLPLRRLHPQEIQI